MDISVDILAKGGRGVFISFHSLEDRIIKSKINEFSKNCICPPSFPKCVCNKVQLVKNLTKKPILPTAEEIQYNNSSRSAKLRAFEKL